MESQLEEELKSRGEQLKHQSVQEEPCVRESTWKPGESKFSVPDLGFGIRNLEVKDNETNILATKMSATSLSDNAASSCNITIDTDASSGDKSDDSNHSQPTVFKVNHHPDSKMPPIVTYNVSSVARNIFPELNQEELNAIKPVVQDQLLSLTELWKQNGTNSHKLEEEKIKRQVCCIS